MKKNLLLLIIMLISISIKDVRASINIEKNNWRFNNRILSIKSLYTEWLSSDNLNTIIAKNNIKDINDFKEHPGIYLGKANLEVRMNCSFEFCNDAGMLRELYLTTKEDANIRSDGFDNIDADYYQVLVNIKQEKAKKLAPNYSGEILEAKLVKITEHTGGSIGNIISYGIYAIIQDNNKESVVPLALFSNQEEAINFTKL